MPVNNYRNHYRILKVTIFKRLLSINVDAGKGYKNCFRQGQQRVPKPFVKGCWGQDSHIFSKYHPIGYLLNTKGKKCHCNAEMGQTFPKPSDQT